MKNTGSRPERRETSRTEAVFDKAERIAAIHDADLQALRILRAAA